LRLIRRIEIQARAVYWSDSADTLAVVTEETFYVLRYKPSAAVVNDAVSPTEDGYEDAIDVVGECQESVKTALWVGDCFVYTTPTNRLNYFVGGETVTIAHMDRPMYLLGSV
jgi:coatomer subunit beta'